MHQRHSFESPPSGMYQRTRSVGASNPSLYQEGYGAGDATMPSPQQSPAVKTTATSSSWFPSGAPFSATKNKNNRQTYKAVGDDELKYHHGNKKGGNRFISLRDTLYWRIIPCLILMILPWFPAQTTRWTMHSQKTAIQAMMEEQKDLVSQLDETTDRIRQLQKDINRLTTENELSYQELDRHGKLIKTQELMDNETYTKQEEVEEAFVKRIDELETNVKATATRRLETRYGSGPYRLRVTVRDEVGIASSFVMETAMTMDMPHAIDHFVRMVERKLWDGLTFVHEYNSRVIMATPLMTDASHTWAGQRFADANLTHMAFTEYSPSFPAPHHRKFSVAFSGRPGGPNFYINLDDELETAHEHESTFAVVMEGRDVLYQFYLKNHASQGEKKMLSIESIEMLTQPNPGIAQ